MNRIENDLLIPKIPKELRKKYKKVSFKKWFCFFDYITYIN